MQLKIVEKGQMDVAETESEYYIKELENLVKNGGPKKKDYYTLRQIAKSFRRTTLEEETKLYEVFKPILNTESIIGHTFQKPYGYAGDHELIDRIYLEDISNDPFLENWDLYFHNADSATAVRNRKDYFLFQLKKISFKSQHPYVLNLGSGPCRDVNEFFLKNKKSNLKIDCLDMDKSAIDYASVVCDNFIDNITFINKNVFLFNPNHKYDLIWSAGLFDYFSDKLFIRLVRKMYKHLNEGCELIIGNFSMNNPGKDEMEVFGKWFLNHRSEEHLIKLALEAGINKKSILVEKEKKGVNLFLHISKSIR